MQGGRRVSPSPTLAEIRARAARDIERLPVSLHQLQLGASYPFTWLMRWRNCPPRSTAA